MGGVRNAYRCNKSDWMCNTSSLHTRSHSYGNSHWHSTTFRWNNILRGKLFKDSRTWMKGLRNVLRPPQQAPLTYWTWLLRGVL